MDQGPYNDTVRQLFAEPLHAGDLPAGEADSASNPVARVSRSNAGCRVDLAAALRDETLQTMRFRVFGCPHLIAAAEAVCADFEGRTTDTLLEFSGSSLMERLGVPVEKTGRILLLEDAVHSLASKLLDGTNPAQN